MPGAADAWCEVRGTDLVLRIRIQPRASRDAIEGVHAGRLRVRITAPPVEGAANARLLEFLAGALDVARRRLAIARGDQARDKDVVLANGAAERDRCLALVLEK
jgi:uncharacterized protein (TIGR00251 family)